MKQQMSGSDGSSVLEAALKGFLRDDEDYSFIKDVHSVYLAASDAFAGMAGKASAEEVVGKTDYDLFSRELADKYREDDRHVFGGTVIAGMVERLPEKDGRERWTKTWKRALFDGKNQLIGLYGIGRDITDSIRLEAAEKTAVEYQRLISNIPGGVAILHSKDGDFYLDYANDGWFSAHHVSKDYGRRFLGANALSSVCEQDRQIILDEFLRVGKAPGAQGGASYRVKGEDGELHWISMQFRSMSDENGKTRFYVSCADLDPQKQTEEKLAESRGALRDTVANSDIQFFTYFPGKKRAEIYTVNNRLSELPILWTDFPEDFLSYTHASGEDAQAYREMIRKIDDGERIAECTVQLSYQGVCSWEKITVRAVRDSSSGAVKGEGYSINVTARKSAEERLQKERVRLKSLEGNVFEAFSFNLSKNSQPNIQTSEETFFQIPIREDLYQEALRISPALAGTNPATRDILLRAASLIPEAKDRELFISTCCGSGVRKAVSEGRYHAEITYRRRVHGAVHWVSSSAEVLPDPESGDLIAFYYTCDVNREAIRDKLAERVLKSNYLAISYCDLQSGILYVQPSRDGAGGRYNGMAFGEAVKSVCDAAVSSEEAESCRAKFSLQAILSALEKGSVYTVYYTGKDRKETLPGKPFRKMKNDIFYLDGHKDVIIFLLSDVTEIFEQERDNREKMAQALTAAEQASVAKTEFLSRMSHEIRTPMNAIIGLDAIALQEQGLSSSMEDHLQKIGISARFLLSLINDILDMSRIESGRMMLRNNPFNFEELISGINTILYEQCRDSGLEYECVLKSFTEETYVGDVTKLQQVLVNILGNAVKFTPAGGKIHFMIEQAARTKEKATLRFEISDTGIGIDEKFLPHLFEPFSQENRGRTSAYGGTGLGLAISKNIVNLMGGTIGVHSIKNVGSEFTVEVVLGLSEDTIRRRVSLVAPLRPLFTLIVDDDVIVCRHTQMILKEAGLQAEWVESGSAAVEKVTAQHKVRRDYDLILLDWQMPDMDGIETARRVRRIVGPDVTIIIMTAYDWADIEKKARAAGVDLFMRKPIFASSVTKAFENVFLDKKGPPKRSQLLISIFRGRGSFLWRTTKSTQKLQETFWR